MWDFAMPELNLNESGGLQQGYQMDTHMKVNDPEESDDLPVRQFWLRRAVIGRNMRVSFSPENSQNPAIRIPKFIPISEQTR
jgi:hypothetical protein